MNVVGTSDDNFICRGAVAVKETGRSIDRTIKAIARAIFEGIKAFVRFPIRFMGSKASLGEGYDGTSAAHGRYLSGREIKDYVRFGAVTCTAYNGNPDWIKPLGMSIYPLEKLNLDLKRLPGNIFLSENALFDEATGLKVMLISSEHRKDEVTVVFAALGAKGFKSHPKYRQYWGATLNVLGIKCNLYKRAEAIFEQLKKCPEFTGKNFVLTGHSLGGGIASYVGLKNEVKTISFSATPVGAGMQESIGKEKLRKAHLNVTQITNPNDFLADCPYGKSIDKVSRAFGIRMPGTFGKRLWFVSDPNCKNPHAALISNLMHRMGYRSDQKIYDLTPEDAALCS